MKTILTIVTLFCFLRGQAVIRYVDIAAAGANNGTSWTDAATSLQAMINSSSAGDSIFVAAGTYQPAAGTSYSLKEGVKIFGGFPHGSNPAFADRNWTLYQSILQGDKVLQLFGMIYNLSAGTVVDGFHLTGATASRQGGIAYLFSTSIQFFNCRFFENNSTSQGGIFYLVDGAPTIKNCIFDNNTSAAQGGIIYNLGSSPQISHCIFSNGRGPGFGSVLFFLGGAPVINNCRFLNNRTEAGLLCHMEGTATLTNCVFANNIAGNVCLLNSISGKEPIIFAGCLFYNNVAERNGTGGMFNNNQGVIDVVNCTFYKNTATGTPTSSLFSHSGTAVTGFVNCIIRNNTAPSLTSTVNGSLPSFSYSIVQGMNDPANQVSDTDPLFADPFNTIGADGVWATADDGLELQAGSPAIDKGNNASLPAGVSEDLNGGNRIHNSTVDLGAYEFLAQARPVVFTSGGVTTYVIQEPPVTVDAGVIIHHPAKTTLATGTVSIRDGFSAGDILSFTPTPAMGNITGAYNTSTGRLELVSAGATATIAQWQMALRAINYSNTLSAPDLATRTITFSVNDGTFSSNAAPKILVLEKPPTCTPTSSTTKKSICRSSLPFSWNNQSFNAAGTYVVHLSNAAGCDSAATLVLTVHEATSGTTNKTICSSELPFEWNGNQYTQAGTYTVRLTNVHGCDSTATLVLVVSPAGKLFAGHDTTVIPNQPIRLQVLDVDQVGYNQFRWAPAYGLNRSDIPNPVATIDRNVTYRVTASTPAGCTGVTQLTLKVSTRIDIHVPNAFSPNNDGKNDILKAIPVGIRKFRFFAVYNRWGEQVFYTTTAANGWDGRISGNLQNPGVFVWVTEGVGNNGSIITRKGTVMLVQ